jgi:hypothetical protein
LQGSIRNRRSDEGDFKLRKLTPFTSFKIVPILLGAALLFGGCSHTKTTKPQKPFKALCLSGSGKGRIASADGKYVFSYENLFKLKEQEWLLGLQLPLHGEEVLQLGFKEAIDSNVAIGGNFFKRLSRAAKAEKREEELAQLKKVLIKMSVFLKTVHMVRIGDYSCVKGQCHKGARHAFAFSEDAEGLKVEFPFDSNHKFVINARANSSYYRKINFILIDKRRRRGSRQPFSLSLIHRQCNNQ